MRRSRLKSLWILPLLLGALSVALGIPRPAQAADDVVLQVQPSSVQFVHADELPQVIVVLRNDSSDTLLEPTATPVTPQGITATQITGGPSSTGPSGAQVPPKGDISWTFRVGQTGPDIEAGTVLFRIQYRTQRETSPVRIMIAPLEVKAGQATATEDVVGAAVRTSLESLDEGTPGVIFLVLTNKADFEVTAQLSQVEPRPAEGTSRPSITFRYDTTEMRVPPGDSMAIRIDVSKTGQIQSGSYIFLFQVRLSWMQNGRDINRNLFVDHPVSIGVFGQSALLSVLAIPTILFLPGFIFMAIVGALWKTRWLAGSDAGGSAFEVKSPIYYVLAISISGLVVFLFRTVGGTNYLGAYGPFDLVKLWLGSSVIAIAFALALGVYLRQRMRARTYVYNEDGVAVLRKLHRHGLGLLLPRTTVAKPAVGQPDLQRAFLLEPLEGRKIVWVAPALVVSWSGTEPPDYHEQFEVLASDEPARRKRSKQMAGLLRRGREAGYLSVYWDRATRQLGPWPMTRKEGDDELEPNLFVRD